MKLLIALPALDEEESLGGVLEKLPRELAGIDSVKWLVIDDGSSDRTGEVALSHGSEVLRHSKNIGVGKAFQTAVGEALRQGVDLMVTMDADGQFDPAQIPTLIQPIVDGEADFVTGSRFVGGGRPKGMPGMKYWGNRMVANMIRFLGGSELSDVSCGFRAYSKEALLHLNLFGKFTYTQETILDLSFKDLRLAEVPIQVTYFADRRSRVAGNLLRYALGASSIFIRSARDYKPLRFFGVAGLLIFAIGGLLDGWLLLHWFRTGSFTPYKVVGFAGVSLNAAGLLVGGLGVLADMLDRMRVNQERLLYFHKLKTYGSSCDSEPPERAHHED